MARPKKDIDEKQVYQLAAINCSVQEIATILKCDPRTLQRRFAGALNEGRENGKMSIKRKQFEVAMKGNVTMLIWVGKQMLGQRDQPVENDGREIPAPVYSIANSPIKTAI